MVWYTFCGSWFIGLVAETILFIFALTYGIPPNVFGYTHVIIQVCRMLILVLLSTVLFYIPSKSSRADEESASLLGQDKSGSNDAKASTGKSGYGSITVTADGEAADLEYEAEERRKTQERMEAMEKRLQAEGNWFTYDPTSNTSPHVIQRSQPHSPTFKHSWTADVIFRVHHKRKAND